MKKDKKSIGFYVSIVIIFIIFYALAFILDNKWYAILLITIALAGLLLARNYKKLRGWKYVISWLLALAVAMTSIVFGRPNLDISFRGSLVNEGIKFFVRTVDKFTDQQIILNTIDDYSYEPYDINSWTVPEGYTNSEITLSNSRGYLLVNEEGNHEKVIYQLHGGAYILPFDNKYNEAALNYSKVYDNADVFSLDYRVAEQATYPGALEDAVEGYQWLLNEGYKAENIVVTGDSAGGGLALALSLKLRDDNMELPKCLILASPWTDLSQEGETYTTNRKNDCYFGSSKEEAIGTKAISVAYAGNQSLDNPYISPVYGEYDNMPPMLIQAGSTEMLLSDSETVYKKAKEANVKAELKVYDGMWHVFYIVMDTVPESKEAWNEIEVFINSLE